MTMFRRSKRDKEKRVGSLSSDIDALSSESVNVHGSNDYLGGTTNKRNFKLFKFSKKEKEKSFPDLEVPESPDSDGIRIDETFQSSHDIHDPCEPLEGSHNVENVLNEKSSEVKNYKLEVLSHFRKNSSQKLTDDIVSFSESVLAENDSDSVYSHSFSSSISSATENKLYSINLKLPTLQSNSMDNESRTINVSRTKAGDFGIVLRRSSSVKKGDKRMIHLVEPSANNLSVGLLPGDHLIALNGINVENFSRKDILGMIASSANTIALTVAPISEFAELSSRSAATQNLSLIPQSAPSLARSGSIHSKMLKKNKNEDSIHENLLNAENVWLVHPNGYFAGQVCKENNLSQTMNKYCVKLENGGEVVDVEEHLIEQVNPPSFNQCEKLSSLPYLNESSCLHTLRQRYAANLIHTFADDSLIIIKPKEKMELYSEKVMQMFQGCKQEDMPPHIFTVAQSAYRNMVASNTNQSILFWGNAGSGKSFNFKKVVQYLCTAVSKESKLTASKIEAAISIIEAFGNVKTNLSANATTFGNLITLEYSSSGFIVGCNMHNIFLGKSYFPHTAEEKFSAYHIFYHLLFSCSGKLKTDLFLDALPKKINLLINKNIEPAEGFNADSWNHLHCSMQMLHFSDDEIMGIFAPLAAILHLGAAGISKVTDSSFYFLDAASALHAASLLGTTEENLARIIFSLPLHKHPSVVNRDSEADKFSFKSISSSSDLDSLTYDALVNALEAFCFGLYIESFNALFRLINRALNTSNRVVSRINVLDMPGFQDQTLIGESCNFQDLCINYCCEKMQWFSHSSRFTRKVERYSRENIECSFDIESLLSPAITISALDKLASDHISSRSSISDEKGLFWINEEKPYTNSIEAEKFEKINLNNSLYKGIVTTFSSEYFLILHYQNTVQLKYNASGWLQRGREHPATKLAYGVLSESSKTHVTELYAGYTSGVMQFSSLGSIANRRRLINQSASPIKNSMILQMKLQMDKLLELLETTRVSFVFCLLPEKDAGITDPLNNHVEGQIRETQTFDVPFIRQQLRSCHLLESMRLHRQGYPEHIPYPEFRQRFNILLQQEDQHLGIVLDEKLAVLQMVTKLDLNEKSYKLGLSQIFFRAGCLAHLEDIRDDHLSIIISDFQCLCKGFLARIKFKKLVLQNVAIQCIQRNVRKYMSVQSWSWWRMYITVLPLLQMHRTEEELQSKTSQLFKLNLKIEQLQKENNEYEASNLHLKKKINELTIELREIQSAMSGTDEILDLESDKRKRLEEKITEIKMENESLKKQREVQQAEILPANILNEPGDESYENIWQEKYKAVWQSCENVKRTLIKEHEKEIEELSVQKRNAEKALDEERSNCDEIQQQMTIMKQKMSKLNGKLEDVMLLLETEQIKNFELEKKEKKFDEEIMNVKEELLLERKLKESIQKDQEMLNAEIYSLQRSLSLKDEENEELKKKIGSLCEDVDGYSSHNNIDDVVFLKKKLREYELKIQDQEEEMDEQAGTIQQLDQAKVKLQMQNHNEKQKYERDLELKEEEISHLRSDNLKKIRALEDQLEEETQTKCELQRAKRDADKLVLQLQASTIELDAEKKLKKELKKMRIMYKDSKAALDNLSMKNSDIELKALRNQLEDCEFTKNMALKAKLQLENDLKELNYQLDNLNQSKMQIEEKCNLLARENADLLLRMEENDDELEEIIRNNKNLVSQISDSQKIIIELREDYQNLSDEKNTLSRTVDVLTQKIDLELSSKVPKTELNKVEMKLRDLENKLELETAIRTKAENQVLRLKGQLERLQDECDQVKKNLSRTQQNSSRIERSCNELRGELESAKIQESEHKRRREELENRLQFVEDELSRKKVELTATEKRIRELQELIDYCNSSDDDILRNDQTDDI